MEYEAEYQNCSLTHIDAMLEQLEHDAFVLLGRVVRLGDVLELERYEADRGLKDLEEKLRELQTS